MADEIAKHQNISIVSAYSMAHDNLQFHEVCVRLVPMKLTDEYKRMRLGICSRHLVRYREQSDSFPQRIITVDEPRIHHC
jgi:hypothetical protein